MISALKIESLAAARGDRLLFDGLDLSLSAGEAVALTGRNGAGKTSLLRVVAGFIRPSAGQVRFLDAAGAALDPEEARARWLHAVGHQDGLKTGRRAMDEFLFQARWTGAEAAGIARARARLDLDRLGELEVRKLSAGQRRRFALARLIASPRRLWLLDEPLAPLDAAARALVGEIMDEHLGAGGMILASVHDPLPVAARDVRIGA